METVTHAVQENEYMRESLDAEAKQNVMREKAAGRSVI
jgi:hypothetical protein